MAQKTSIFSMFLKKKRCFLMPVCTLILLHLNCHFAKAQTYSTAFHNYADNSRLPVELNRNAYFVLDVNNYGVDSNFVVSLNSAGKIRFKKRIQKGPTTRIKSLIIGMDKSIVLAGGAGVCDVPSPNDPAFIVKLDTNGNVLFDNTFTITASGDPLICLAQRSDSSFYAGSSNKLFHFSKSGVLINSYPLNFSVGKAIISATNGNLIVGATEIDTTGTLVQSIPTLQGAKKIERLGNGELVVLYNNNQLNTLNTSFGIVSSYGSNPIEDFSVLSDTIYCISNTVSRNIACIKLDNNLSVISNTFSPSGFLKGTGVFASSSRGFLLSYDGVSKDLTTGFPGGYQGNTFAGLTLTDNNGVPDYSQNIGITACVLDSGYAYATSYVMGPTTVFGHNRFRVQITNFGTDTVHSFYLNNNRDVLGVACGTHYYYQYVPNVSIPPAGSMTLITNFYDQLLTTVFSSVVPLPINITNYCLFTTAPNFQVDADNSNDGICINFTYWAVTGLQEEEVLSESLRVYPNPSNGVLFYESQVPIIKIEIVDLLGRTVQIPDRMEDNRIQLPEQSGLYFVRLYSERASVIKKVIID